MFLIYTVCDSVPVGLLLWGLAAIKSVQGNILVLCLRMLDNLASV